MLRGSRALVRNFSGSLKAKMPASAPVSTLPPPLAGALRPDHY